MEWGYSDDLGRFSNWSLEDLSMVAVCRGGAVEGLDSGSIVSHTIEGLEDVWRFRIWSRRGGW